MLVERDIDSWCQSFEVLITAYYLQIRPVLQYLVPQLIGRTAGTFGYVFKDQKGFFRAGNKTELQQNWKMIWTEQLYEYELVRRFIRRRDCLNSN